MSIQLWQIAIEMRTEGPLRLMARSLRTPLRQQTVPSTHQRQQTTKHSCRLWTSISSRHSSESNVISWSLFFFYHRLPTIEPVSGNDFFLRWSTKLLCKTSKYYWIQFGRQRAFVLKWNCSYSQPLSLSEDNMIISEIM